MASLALLGTNINVSALTGEEVRWAALGTGIGVVGVDPLIQMFNSQFNLSGVAAFIPRLVVGLGLMYIGLIQPGTARSRKPSSGAEPVAFGAFWAGVSVIVSAVIKVQIPGLSEPLASPEPTRDREVATLAN